MEGPEVVVSQVHQVLQGRVKLLHDALDPEGKETERGHWERKKNDERRHVSGPQKQGTRTPMRSLQDLGEPTEKPGITQNPAGASEAIS